MQYLDKAMNGLHDLGLVPQDAKTHEEPIVALLNQISALDEGRVAAMAPHPRQASLFNEVVRQQVQAMDIGSRYEEITDAFNSIRDDAKAMVDQVQDGRLDTFERIGNVWMKVSRGDIASRFDKIKGTYLAVTPPPTTRSGGSRNFSRLTRTSAGPSSSPRSWPWRSSRRPRAGSTPPRPRWARPCRRWRARSTDRTDRAKLALARDEQVRALQNDEKRYQIAKDLSDNLTVSYNTSEVVMARLLAITTAKERVYPGGDLLLHQRGGAHRPVGLLHRYVWAARGTQTIEAMKEGVSQSLEVLAEIGGKVQEAAVRAGYGPTIRADAIKKLVDSVVTWQERSHEIIEEMRKASTANANEIRDAVEDGKRRLARLAEQGKGLTLEAGTLQAPATPAS